MENNNYTVNITISKKQSYILREALESYARMTAGQLEIALDPLFIHYEGHWHSDVVPLIKDLHSVIYTETMKKEMNDDSRIAWDLMQVVRYNQSWKDFPKGGIQVQFDRPMKGGSEPLAECSIGDKND
jgi:hypothetical protein